MISLQLFSVLQVGLASFVFFNKGIIDNELLTFSQNETAPKYLKI